jgi:hypothetical protein
VARRWRCDRGDRYGACAPPTSAGDDAVPCPIVIAIFMLITPYVSHLYDALREFGSSDG